MSAVQNHFFGTVTVCLCSYFTAGKELKEKNGAPVEGAVTGSASLLNPADFGAS